jgi:hypothetical protein
MSTSTLDRLRTITHDAGAAAGHGLADVSGAAIDASSTLTRRLSPRRIVIGVGVVVAAGILAALVVRFRRSEDSLVESDLDARRDVRMAG